MEERQRNARTPGRRLVVNQQLKALIDRQECLSYYRNTTSTPIALSLAKPGIQCGFRRAITR